MPDAKTLVALARKAAAWRFERAASYLEPWRVDVFGLADFEIANATFNRGKRALMSAPLSAENIASEDALARALLASAVRYKKADGEEYYFATIGDGGLESESSYGSFTQAEALNGLLDSVTLRDLADDFEDAV